jgi:uncharacterized protein
MSTTYSYPGVYIQELQSSVHTIAAVATSITAFVGYTKSGIDNRAEQIFSFSDFERLFGGLAPDSELGYAVQQFFQNEGSQAYVVRVPKHGASGATVQFGGLTFTALSSGSWADGQLLIDVDYQGVDQVADATAFNLTVTNLVDGTVEAFPNVSLNPAQSNYVAAIVNDPDTGSQLVNVAVKSPAPTTPPDVTGLVGTAVTVPAVLKTAALSAAATGTFNLTQNSTTVVPSSAANLQNLRVGQYLVFAADASNTPYQIAAISVSAPSLTLSTPYTPVSAPTSATQMLSPVANANFGLQLTVTKPSPAPSPLPLSITVFALGATISQSLTGVAAQLQQAISAVLNVQMPGASVSCSVATVGTGQGIRVNLLLPQSPDAVVQFNAPASGSDARALLGLTTTANVAHYALGTTDVFGSQTASAAGSDGSGLPHTGDLIGDPAAFTGLYALGKVDLFNLLSIPDATRANPGDPSSLDSNVDPNAIYGAAITMCDQRRAFLLIDPPPNINNVSAAVDWKSTHLAVVDPNGAAFFPRLRLPDPLNNYQLRTFAPSGVVAGVYAKIDGSRGVWKAPAGTEATLNGVQSMVYKLSDPENGVLNPLGLNCFRTFPVYGSVLWGARTLVGADALTNQWKYVPVRRMALFLEESLYRGTKWVVFEPNDEPLWAAIRLNVGAFMQDFFRRGAFQGKTPDQAYFVKCDSETTTQNDIDLGVVNILVGFAPLKPAEFVVIKIEQLTGQAQA